VRVLWGCDDFRVRESHQMSHTGVKFANADCGQDCSAFAVASPMHRFFQPEER
jgi:hypothetical protein